MDHAKHRHTPVGPILTNHEGEPFRLHRDYTGLELAPGKLILLDQLDVLRQVIDEMERDGRACQAEMAADTDAEGEDDKPGAGGPR